MRKTAYLLMAVLLVAAAGLGSGCKSKTQDTAPDQVEPPEKETQPQAEQGEQGPAKDDAGAAQKTEPDAIKSHVLMVIACENFRDEELLKPRDVLGKNGLLVTVASDKKEGCKGMLGAEAAVDSLITEVKAQDFGAVVFVGGTGAKIYLDNADAHKLATEAVKEDRVLGAICLAPAILAKAGVLKGKKATVYNDEEFIGILKEGGADYTGDKVTVDGKIVTAHGPDAAAEFGEKLAELLKGASPK
jgi:protease I